jgi:hypothetical protein
MPKRTNPGDVANLFIRCFLADVGEALSGCSDVEWKATLEFFGNRCGYTDEPLSIDSAVMDHAIPINKDHCGLHLVGNLIPCTNEANRRKHHLHFRDFATSGERRDRIEEWLRRCGYWERVGPVGDLRVICAEKYRTIVQSCEAGRADAFERFASFALRDRQRVQKRSNGASLPIALVCRPDRNFKDELLRQRHAWITVEYANARKETKLWTADKLTADSNIIGNLRSRPEFRNGTWQSHGIVKVVVTLDPPAT